MAKIADVASLTRSEGIAEEKKATASKMKSMGLPIDSISEITGLSVEDIKDL